MKSVIFVSYSMGIGGVEKALLGVVNSFVKDGWNVHIALIKPEGDFLEYLPNSVFVHNIDCFEQIRPLIHTPIKKTIIDSLKKGDLLKSFWLGVCLIDSKIRGGAKLLYDYAFRIIPKDCHTYDLAVAFAGPDAFIDTYVNKCIDAKEKWGWIHFDISKFGNDKSIISRVYKSYSVINIVSKQAKDIFDKIFPKLSDRTKCTPNIIDKEMILKMSDTVTIDRPDKFIILTVGRISKEKGQLKALEALKLLIDKGVKNIQWWFVGSGNDVDRCRKYVQDNRLSEYVCFFGAQANPYPYMKKCDLYVQPSEHEGFCITLAEAKLFGMPIVATDFTGAREQLADYHAYSKVIEHNAFALAEAIMEAK